MEPAEPIVPAGSASGAPTGELPIPPAVPPATAPLPSPAEETDFVATILNHQLRQQEIRKILLKLTSSDQGAFTDRLSELLRKTAAMLEVSREMSSSLSLDVLLPRMVELTSEFLDAERCTIFLHDPESDELYTKASVDAAMKEVRIPSTQGIAGAVFASGQTLHIPDAYADARFSPEVDRKTGFVTRNVLCAPIKHTAQEGTRTIGVAQVLNKRKGAFRAEDQAVLEALTSQAASALTNAMLHRQIERARAEELHLLEVTTALSSELQLQPLLCKIMETVKLILESDKATLFMHDPRTDELWALVTQDEAISTLRFPASLGIAGSVFTTGQTVNIPDAYADPRFNREVDRATSYHTHTILCMPVYDKRGRIIAVTQVLNRKGGPFTKTDENRLRAFSAQASIAIQNAQLFDEVLRVKNYNESILESMSNGVVTVDGSDTIVKANSAAGRILRQPVAALAGRAARDFFAGGNAWIAEAIENVRRTGSPEIAVDADVHVGAREPVTANVTVVPLLDPKGAPSGCLTMLEDITIEKRLRSTMARYMTKEVADKLLEEGEAALGGKLQKASVLFTDIRSFTTISERMGPQETVRLLNDYFGIMVDIILERGGILDKYIGDAMMAVFGAPFTSPEDADHAVAASIEMLRALQVFNARRAVEGLEPVLMGLGINTDDVVSGNIGSLKRMDYTVIGDGVNLASRLESANKHYGTQILISDLTARELKGSYRMREVDLLVVKGKKLPVGVFEVLDYADESLFPNLEPVLATYKQALDAYRQREFAPARALFEDALQLHPGDALSRMYVERCAYFADHPPPDDWAGVWVMSSK